MGFSATIMDSCSCGAMFNAHGDHVDISYDKWLKAHKPCRDRLNKAPQAQEEGHHESEQQ